MYSWFLCLSFVTCPVFSVPALFFSAPLSRFGMDMLLLIFVVYLWAILSSWILEMSLKNRMLLKFCPYLRQRVDAKNWKHISKDSMFLRLECSTFYSDSFFFLFVCLFLIITMAIIIVSIFSSFLLWFNTFGHISILFLSIVTVFLFFFFCKCVIQPLPALCTRLFFFRWFCRHGDSWTSDVDIQFEYGELLETGLRDRNYVDSIRRPIELRTSQEFSSMRSIREWVDPSEGRFFYHRKFNPSTNEILNLYSLPSSGTDDFLYFIVFSERLFFIFYFFFVFIDSCYRFPFFFFFNPTHLPSYHVCFWNRLYYRIFFLFSAFWEPVFFDQ